MKRLTFLFIITYCYTTATAQLFDGTIFGAMPGRQKDLVAYFEKKGYRIIHDANTPNDTVIMEGIINGSGNSYNNVDNIIRIHRDSSDANYIQSITFLYSKNTDSVISQMKYYQKVFINSFGLPSHELPNLYRWIFLNYIYTIGNEEGRVYHKLEINQKSNEKNALR
jgi:hypothetical protein